MDEFETSFFLLRAFAGPLTAFVAAMVFALLFGPVVLYILARWRAQGAPDRQLGMKFALHYFALTGFQLALAGGGMLLWTMISPGAADAKGGAYRVAFGLVVPAGLILAAHLAALRRTDDDRAPSVRRLFAGYNLMLTGLAGSVALVAGFQMLFAKGSTHGMGHLAAAMVLVYGSAWGVLAWRFGQLVLGGSGFGAAPPSIETVSPPAAPPAAPGTPSLPALGGGSYPPIDR